MEAVASRETLGIPRYKMHGHKSQQIVRTSNLIIGAMFLHTLRCGRAKKKTKKKTNGCAPIEVEDSGLSVL
jgi:hypothetical protein